jgi:hypothetical protein
LKLARDAFNIGDLQGRTPVLGKLLARLLRLRRKAPAPAAAPDVHIADYRAVSIVPATGSCAEARRLRKKRYLSNEAPRLPLPQCPQRLTCPCRYRKFPDRRVTERRDVASSGRWFMGQQIREDRRKSSGRRASDYSRIEIPWPHRD